MDDQEGVRNPLRSRSPPPPTPHDGTKALIPSDSPLPNPRIASGPQNYQDSIMLVIKFIDLSFRN